MCGLVWVYREDGQPARQVALKRYHKQSSRGKEGYGYIPVENGRVTRVMRFTEEKPFLDSISKEETTELLIHHRAPTTTENVLGATHPVEVKDDMFKYNYYLAHNGTITNNKFLKEQHEKAGLVYNTEFTVSKIIKFKNRHEEVGTYETGFLDSESLAKEVALFLEGKTSKISTFGGASFICYQTEKDGRIVAMYFGRNDIKPLVLETVISKKKKKKQGNYICLKSEGGGQKVDDDMIYRLDYNTKKMTQIDTRIGDFSSYARTPAMGYHGVNNIGTPTPSTTRVIEAPRSVTEHLSWGEKGDEKHLFTYESDKKLNDVMVKMSKTKCLEDRLEVIEDEIVGLEYDRKEWLREVNSSESGYDIATASGEVDAVNDEMRILRKEKDRIEDELVQRYAEADYTKSPYQEHIVNIDQ